MRKLVVNADDFGFTRDVNAGIVECHRNGILTATTLMANGDAFQVEPGAVICASIGGSDLVASDSRRRPAPSS